MFLDLKKLRKNRFTQIYLSCIIYCLVLSVNFGNKHNYYLATSANNNYDYSDNILQY